MKTLFFCFYFFMFIYLTEGILMKKSHFLFLNQQMYTPKNRRGNKLFCYKKRVKASELRKLSTEELEKEIVKCRTDIQIFQQQGFYDIHNYNIQYEKNAKRKLAQLLTIYYERYLDNNIRIKTWLFYFLLFQIFLIHRKKKSVISIDNADTYNIYIIYIYIIVCVKLIRLFFSFFYYFQIFVKVLENKTSFWKFN